MRFGFVKFNQEEQKNVLKVLQMLRDERAIDELGIGRLRDAFSNKMFPGMSQLQNHAKYFVLLPSLYYQAQRRTYRNDREVRDEIKRMEINLTKQLINGTPENLRFGITGSDNIDAALKDSNRFVKYDPTYIYQSGLLTYGIITHQGNLFACIREQGQSRNSRPRLFKDREGKDEMEDFGDPSATSDCFATTGEEYDFSTSKGEIRLQLTPRECEFLKRHIETAAASSDSLLAYILRNDLPWDWPQSEKHEDAFSNYDSLGEIWKAHDVPEKYLRPYELSRRFSRFVYMLRVVYEIMYTELTERTEELEFARSELDWCVSQSDYRRAVHPDAIDEILSYFAKEVTEISLLQFCRSGAAALTKYFEHRSDANFNEIKNLVKTRERCVKGKGRSKLLHPNEYRNVRHGIARPLSYRWGIVRRMISEIRGELGNV